MAPGNPIEQVITSIELLQNIHIIAFTLLIALHVERIEDILFRLDNALQPKDMDLPGWNLHKLSGRLKGFSAVWVSGNFRIWFRMENGDAFDVDYGDYH